MYKCPKSRQYTGRFFVKVMTFKNYLGNYKQKSPADLNSESVVLKTNMLDH